MVNLKNFGVVFLLLGMSCQNSLAQIDKTRDIENNRDDADLVNYYRNLVKQRSNARIDNDTGLALAARWIDIRQSMLTEMKKSQKERLKVDPFEIGRLIGFLVGRTNVEVPQWWRKRLVQAILDERGFLDTSTTSEEVLGIERVSFNVIHTKGFEIKLDTNVLAVKRGKKTYTLPSQVLQDVKRSVALECLAIVGTCDERIVILPYGKRCSSYPVISLGPNKNSEIWTSQVWTSFGGVGFSGDGRSHFVSGVYSEDTLYVFGQTAISFYIEVFDAKNGQIEWRFSTRY